MNCPNCGTSLPEGTTLCTTCGSQIQGAQSSVNDALFNQASSAPAPKKKGGKVIGIIVGVIALLALVFVVGYFVLGGRYNGTYKLDTMEAYGMTMSTDDIVEMYGENFEMEIKVAFNRCTVKADLLGSNDSGGGKIKISGDEVTISDAGQELTGTYDSSKKAIILDVEGVKMSFVKQ